MARLQTAITGVFVCALTASCVFPSAGWAHGNTLPDINVWGPFDPGTAQCQRTLSTATQRCFDRVLSVERHCMDAEMAGQPCSDTTRDGRIAVAKQAAQDQVANACTSEQLQQLHFTGTQEAQTDVARACTEQADAAVSLLYGPVVARGSAAADDTMRGCLQQTSALGTKLLRVAARLRSRALDRIATRTNLTTAQKQALLNQATSRIAAARDKVAQLIAAACPTFDGIYSQNMTGFMNLLEPRADCLVSYGHVQGAITCPAPVCGNGVKEGSELCDDGNTLDDDLCHNNCTPNPCTVFPSTFALIQSAIFENHSCTNPLCHGSNSGVNQGNLDLRPNVAYANLLAVPSFIDPRIKRIEPGDQDRSMLWLKLAAATLHRSGVPGSPMPQNLLPLSDNELEAMRRWIHAAAPESGTVSGVAELLDACALPPDPIAIKPLDPPAAGTGVQMHMPRWELPPQSETEVCFASYYDFTDQVPTPNGGNFRFRKQQIAQDPESHHLIVNLYRGPTSINDPSWGPFTCKGGAKAGDPCDPMNQTGCGTDGVCGSEPTRSVACIGFGPPDLQTSPLNGGFTGTQETAVESTFPDGVYEEMPMKGIIVWNSHAFNLSRQPAKEEAWLNFYFAPPDDQKYPIQGIFDAKDIFIQDVPPFETREYCSFHELYQHTNLFQLSSHNHKRGKRFDIFLGKFHCAGGPNDGSPCSPLRDDMCGGSMCVDDAGRNGQQSLLFTSFIYNDPLQLNFDPPMVFADPDPLTRTLTYCVLYDNGAAPNYGEVKTKSGSPPPPAAFAPGGPCVIPSGCTEGKVGQRCAGSTQAKRNSACDTSPGAGDGFCDACTLKGGVTTEDEMDILLGSYFIK